MAAIFKMAANECCRLDAPETGTERRRDAIALRVEVPADLHRVARLQLVVVVVHGRLEQEGVLALRFSHSPHAIAGLSDEDARLGGLHVGPHPLVHGDLGFLQDTTITDLRQHVILYNKQRKCDSN